LPEAVTQRFPKQEKDMRLIKVLISLFVVMFMASGSAWSDEAVNINTATVKELQKVDGIGKKIAAKIVAYREEHGGFGNVDELKKVNGFGKKTLEKARDQLTVGNNKKEGGHG
jgi:competence protein ComEA